MSDGIGWANGWRPKVVLFDLDGTLIDSAGDLHACVNAVLAANGHAPLPLESVRSMIGDGVKKLVERAFAAAGAPLDEAALEARTEEMMAVYGANLVRHTTLMPGAGAAVSRAAAAGAVVGVVTNKPAALTQAILDHFGLAGTIPIVVGGDSGVPRKPAPDMLLLAVDKAGGAKTEAIMVGDSKADINAARSAGIASIAVHGGYSEIPADALGADWVLPSLESFSLDG